MVAFIVNTKGEVVDAIAIRATNAAFAEAAVRAVLQWKFKPGMKNGRLVNTRMQVPIIFQLEDTPGGGYAPYAVAGQNRPAELPEEFRYDTPPRPIAAAEPVYPFELMFAGTEGTAKVALVISRSGEVSQTELLQASHPEFGQSLLACAQLWKFEPASREGQPTRSMLVLERKFHPDGLGDVPIHAGSHALLKDLRKKREKYLKLSEADHPPKPLSQDPPVYPPALLEQGEPGEAVVEFFIDEYGRTMLPRIISATRPEFGYAAVQAVAGWLFSPAAKKKRPVIVKVQIPLYFKPTAGTGTDGGLITR